MEQKKIYYASDLHLEFEDNKLLKMYDVYKYEGNNYQDSYLVLAGDICCYNHKDKFNTFFEYISKKFKRVIYISGNHEYYKKTLNDNTIKELLQPFENVYFLQDSFKTFEDDKITFYGTTLWTRLSENNGINMSIQNTTNDYKYIRVPYSFKKLTREKTGEMFEISFEKIKNFLKNKPEGKTIIVTHHLPLIQLIVEKYKDYEFNSAYASDLHDELIKFDFDCWIFGHTHFTMRYDLINVKSKSIPFVCNPRGYNSENKEFSEDMHILI